jgi:hypothetical protein
MATRQQIKNIAVDAIQKGFLEQITPVTIPAGVGDLITELYVSASNYQTFVDQTSGQLTTGTSNGTQQTVLYQEDYQHAQSNFNTFIEEIANCYQHPNSNAYDEFSPTFGTSNNHFIYTAETAIIAFQSNNAGDGTACTATSITLVDALSSLAQFQSLGNVTTIIDPTQAQEVLDTTIFELLPQQTSKQDRINQFFTDYSNLKGNYPNFDNDLNTDGVITDDDAADNNGNPYSSSHDITIDNPQGSIPRLNDDTEGTDNETQTLEWLKGDLDLFFKNVDDQTTEDFLEYKERSTGYLKFRNLNQAIIIRNSEGRQVINDDWQTTGFTISMWVRFKDKVSSGTLFNYGNPTRPAGQNPMGFKLETIIANKSDYDVEDIPGNMFINQKHERVVRLVVQDSGIWDSHVGNTNNDKLNIANINDLLTQHPNYIFNYTNIPIDLTEWYFIVATYNPNNDEDTTQEPGSSYLSNSNYWNGNILVTDDGAQFTHRSGYGNRCKVEIISKKDLLRARGFKAT